MTRDERDEFIRLQADVATIKEDVAKMSATLENLNTMAVRMGGMKWAILAMGAGAGYMLTQAKSILHIFGK